MTLTIPLRVLSDAGVGSWRLRAFHCRYSAVLFYITMYISILLLGLISLDRYLKIVRPFGKCALQRVRVSQVLSAVIWVVMLSLALPNVILSDQPPRVSGGRLKCTSMKSKAGLLWHEGFNYFCQVAIIVHSSGIGIIVKMSFTTFMWTPPQVGTTVWKVGTRLADFDITYAETWRTKVNVWLMVTILFLIQVLCINFCSNVICNMVLGCKWELQSMYATWIS